MIGFLPIVPDKKYLTYRSSLTAELFFALAGTFAVGFGVFPASNHCCFRIKNTFFDGSSNPTHFYESTSRSAIQYFCGPRTIPLVKCNFMASIFTLNLYFAFVSSYKDSPSNWTTVCILSFQISISELGKPFEQSLYSLHELYVFWQLQILYKNYKKLPLYSFDDSPITYPNMNCKNVETRTQNLGL